MLSAAGYSYADQVDAAVAFSRVGQKFPQGCGGLVAELLGRPWQRVIISHSLLPFLGDKSGITVFRH